MSDDRHPCPLCGGPTEPFHSDRRRDYHRCPGCGLIHVPRSQQLDATGEKAEYDLHRNDPDDPGYRRFLERAAAAVRARVTPPAHGLDFGCGPGPTLSLMLEDAGYSVALYDKYYAAHPGALQQRYDFITATEVFEHLGNPAAVLRRLLGCLHPGGWLVVMTKRARGDRAAFADWHYIHDPTHVAFFSDATFEWIAAKHGLRLEFVCDDVVALQR
ncbi:MAG: methyltransferase domain-containing protein [Halofilum sp. (in: g-proteobacteria)]|nr:methyltransferase domain-containing protein [Halofilum sp. (in: g-proteobacteria)]